MRQNTQVEWEILEAEAEEWVEVTMAPPAGEPRPARWQWLAKLLGSVALLATLTGLAGYRLVQDAEAGIAATERHIGTLVEVETIRRQRSDPASGLMADVQAVDIKGRAAMVRVVVTETSPLGEVCPHTDLLFYRRSSAGWKRTGPIAAFWGKAAALDTATLHFDFYELDRPYVEAVAQPIDSFHRMLRQFLGLPPLSATDRVTITVVPKNVYLDVLADGTLINTSPLLRTCSGGCERAKMLLAGLHAQLITRSLQESQIYYGLQTQWEEMYPYLASWLYERRDDLITLAQEKAQENRSYEEDIPPFQSVYLLRSPVSGNSAYNIYPGYDEYRRQSTAYAVATFFDLLIANRGPRAVPTLLSAFGREDNWPDVIQTAFGLSVEELQAEWSAYLQALQKKTECTKPVEASSLPR